MPLSRRPGSAVRLPTLSMALLVFGAGPSAATLVPESSNFGEDTLTHDTETGLRWFDVTLSTNQSYADVLAELEPGGTFEGFRLWRRATRSQCRARTQRGPTPSRRSPP